MNIKPVLSQKFHMTSIFPGPAPFRRGKAVGHGLTNIRDTVAIHWYKLNNPAFEIRTVLVSSGCCGPLLTFLGVVCDRKVDVRLPGKGNSNYYGARPVHSSHLDDQVDSDT